MPNANMRLSPVAGSTWTMRARSCSTAMPRLPTLLLEPIETYSVSAFGAATTFFVQW